MPNSIALDELAPAIDAETIWGRRIAARDPRLSLRAFPIRAVFGKTPLQIHGLRRAAVMAEHADASFRSMRDGQVVKLKIDRILGFALDHPTASFEVEAIGGG